MTTPTLEDVAHDIIALTGGDITDKNIDGVVTVLRGIIKGTNNKWETFLMNETNELLMRDNIKCSCGNDIQISRTQTVVRVEC